MKINVKKELVNIYNFLINEDINRYLISKDFNQFCEKNRDIKDIWYESEAYANTMSFLLFSFRGKSELVLASLGIFLEKISSLEKNDFLKILLNILKDFYRFKNKEIDLHNIYKNLKNLNINYEDFLDIYNKI